MAFNVIAEGVETTQQRQVLIDMNCRFFQGYLFDRPTPIENLFKIQHTRNHLYRV